MSLLPDPIARVSLISTGTVAIRPEHVGPTRKNTYVWLFSSRRWTEPRPINGAPRRGWPELGTFEGELT